MLCAKLQPQLQPQPHKSPLEIERCAAQHDVDKAEYENEYEEYE